MTNRSTLKSAKEIKIKLIRAHVSAPRRQTWRFVHCVSL